MGITHLHQLLPQLTGRAIVACRDVSKQGDMERRSGTGLKEDRTLRKHGWVCLRVPWRFNFLVHDADQEQFHKFPAVQFVTIAV